MFVCTLYLLWRFQQNATKWIDKYDSEKKHQQQEFEKETIYERIEVSVFVCDHEIFKVYWTSGSVFFHFSKHNPIRMI